MTAVVANTKQGSSGSVGKEPGEKTPSVVVTRSAGESTVVLRATVEHYGAAGAGSISTQPSPSAPQVGSSKPRNDNQPGNFPDALIVQSVPDPSNESNEKTLLNGGTQSKEGDSGSSLSTQKS
jgi:hypothetical protein